MKQNRKKSGDPAVRVQRSVERSRYAGSSAVPECTVKTGVIVRPYVTNYVHTFITYIHQQTNRRFSDRSQSIAEPAQDHHHSSPRGIAQSFHQPSHVAPTRATDNRLLLIHHRHPPSSLEIDTFVIPERCQRCCDPSGIEPGLAVEPVVSSGWSSTPG